MAASAGDKLSAPAEAANFAPPADVQAASMETAAGTNSPAAPAPTDRGAVPPIRRSLKKNVFFALSGSVALNAARFAVVVLLAKLGTAEVVGQYTYANALAAPAILFICFQLRASLVADAENKIALGNYQVLQGISIGLATLALVGVLLWRAPHEPTLGFLGIIAGVWVSKMALHYAELYQGIFQKQERLEHWTWSNGFRAAAMIGPYALSLATTWWLTGGKMGVASAGAAAAVAAGVQGVLWLGIFWFYDRRLALKTTGLSRAWDWGQVRALFIRAIPLSLILLLINLCDSVPRWIIEDQPDGKQQLGFFGALAYLTAIGQLFIAQVGLAASNRLAQYYRTNLRAFTKLAFKLVGLAGAIGGAIYAVAWLAGPWLLTVFYTPEYAQYHREFMIIVLSQCLIMLGSIFGFIITQMERFWIQVGAQALVLSVTTATALVLIPRDPVAGGVWSTLARTITHVSIYLLLVVVAVHHRHREQRRTAPAVGR